jgi:quercetin dioxygenase-like cupin family protein
MPNLIRLESGLDILGDRMKIIELFKDVPTAHPTGGIWEIGPVYVTPGVNKQMGSTKINVARVTFPPGCRTTLHTHEHEQVLYIIEGQGILATENQENTVYPGTLVLVPPGEKHWHGATKSSFMSHLSITNII